MSTVPTFTASGTKATTAAKLSKDIFAVDVTSHGLIKQAYVAYQANGRLNLAKTLRRGEVRGGGRKPWKQKGTGRARFGSIRVPIWRGGGITFGPLGNENYKRKMTVKAKRQAIRHALSVNADSIVVTATPSFDGGKTAKASEFFKKVSGERAVLYVVTDKDKQTLQATNNLKYVTVVSAQNLNVYDIMNAHSIVITQDSLAKIEEWLGEAHTKAKETKK